MNPIIENDTSRQQARDWSERLGDLAAEVPTIRPALPFTQLSDTTARATLPAHLSALLRHLGHQSRAREHAADKLRAQEFIKGP